MESMTFSGLPYLGTTDTIYYCIYDKISNDMVREDIFELNGR